MDDAALPSEPAASPSLVSLHYDPRWLAITRAFQPFFPLARHPSTNPALPTDEVIIEGMIEKELDWVRKNVPDGGEGIVGECEVREDGGRGVGFVKTAKAIGDEGGEGKEQRASKVLVVLARHWLTLVESVERTAATYSNPQTVAFCKMLGIDDRVSPPAPPALPTA